MRLGICLAFLLSVSLGAASQQSSQELEQVKAEIELLKEAENETAARLARIRAQKAALEKKAAELEVGMIVARSSSIKVPMKTTAAIYARDTTADEKVGSIPRGAVATVLRHERKGFWAVEYEGVRGFALDMNFDTSDRTVASVLGTLSGGERTFNSSGPSSAPSSLYGSGSTTSSSSPGSTGASTSSSGSSGTSSSVKSSSGSSSSSSRKSVATQCRGTTQKGARCKRRTTNSSGLCWQHQ